VPSTRLRSVPKRRGNALELRAERAGSLSEGTPINYRDIQVGRIVEVKLADDKQDVRVEIFINAPYDQLVRDNTRFWQTSGIDLSMTTQGFNLKVGSLLSLLSGGITFETPNLGDLNAKPSADDTVFTLHKDFASIAEGSYQFKKPYMLLFDDSVRGLSAGAPVEIKGIRIGTVTEVRFFF